MRSRPTRSPRSMPLCAHLRSLGEVDFRDITPASFPLPILGAVLGRLGDELRHGRGFLLLRGLPRERYALDDMARIYFGLGAHIGRPLHAILSGRAARPCHDVKRHREPSARLPCRRRAGDAHR